MSELFSGRDGAERARELQTGIVIVENSPSVRADPVRVRGGSGAERDRFRRGAAAPIRFSADRARALLRNPSVPDAIDHPDVLPQRVNRLPTAYLLAGLWGGET